MSAYDHEFWDAYADSNESRYNEAFAGFVRDLAISLRCSSVLEVGCGTCIDLRLFAGGAYGVDPNTRALQMAPGQEVCAGLIERLPFADSSMDMVFTHQLLGYLDDHTLEAGMDEMLRVSSRYVLSCEGFSGGPATDGSRRRRDMRSMWAGRGARVVSDVDMHREIEPEGARFTLVGKA